MAPNVFLQGVLLEVALLAAAVNGGCGQAGRYFRPVQIIWLLEFCKQERHATLQGRCSEVCCTESPLLEMPISARGECATTRPSQQWIVGNLRLQQFLDPAILSQFQSQSEFARAESFKFECIIAKWPDTRGLEVVASARHGTFWTYCLGVLTARHVRRRKLSSVVVMGSKEE